MRVWWKCSLGHEWKARIDSRSAGASCPFCSRSRVLKNFNDLAYKKPNLLSEWDYTNNKIKPDEIISGSRTEVWWKCAKGHSYRMSAANKVNGYGCPVCNCRVIVKGVNDLMSVYPQIASEWHPTKNNKLTPDQVSYKANIKVWWLGKCEHEWETLISCRTVQKTGCPICALESHSSVSEKEAYYYINKYFKDVQQNFIDKFNGVTLELDIYMPNIKVAIEYDCERWHKEWQRDLLKDKMCEKLGIKLIRIREKGCPSYETTATLINLNNNSYSGRNSGLSKLLSFLFVDNFDVDIERDTPEILRLINFMSKKRSLQLIHPEIAEEWHPTKNGNLKPVHTKVNSNKKVWWLGRCGHEWQATVYDRTTGDNCPFCSNHKVLSGFNDLETINPILAKEWHPMKNVGLKPSEVLSGSGKKVWWLGRCGHEWQATISKRHHSHRNCPFCNSNRVLKGFNDLNSNNPILVKEWNYNKNTDIDPSEVTSHSGKKVWWKCGKCNFEWQATIDKRQNGRGCPCCAGKVKLLSLKHK